MIHPPGLEARTGPGRRERPSGRRGTEISIHPPDPDALRAHEDENPPSEEGLAERLAVTESLHKRYRRNRRRRRAQMIYAPFACLALALTLVSASAQNEPAVAAVRAPEVEAISPPVAPPPDLDLERIAAEHPGKYGIYVYDPGGDHDYGVNEEEEFKAASLAKLPVLMTLYRQAANGEIDLDEEITIQPADIQSYGSGELQNYPPGHTMKLRECAEFMIEDSDNTAWVMLERRLGQRRIGAELDRLKLDETDYEDLTTTPKNVLWMLREISNPDYTSPELSREMLGFMTDTAYETRLPSTLPDDVRVAHKVGSLEDTFSDAGIIFEKSEDDEIDYMIVVISEGLLEQNADEAIGNISREVHDEL